MMRNTRFISKFARTVVSKPFPTYQYSCQHFSAPFRAFSTEGSKENNVEPENVPPTEQPTVEDPTIKLQKEVKTLKDQVLRLYAEEENVRRIAKRDVENARQYANTSFAKSMLEIADSLDLALNSIPPEKRQQGDDTFKTLVQGIEMTEKNLQKAFSKFGVKKFGNVGDDFDPSLHEALFEIPDSTRQAGKIAQIVKSGYTLNGRVVRAAEVGTIKHPEN